MAPTYRHNLTALAARAVGNERYNLILGAIVTAYVLNAIDADAIAAIAGTAAVVLTVGALVASSTRRLNPALVWTPLVLILALTTTEYSFRNSDQALLGPTVTATLALISAVTIARRVLTRGPANLSSVAAAASAYLLVGFGFAGIYLIIDRVNATSFLTTGQPLTQEASIYFSFVTLTTLGFGDLTPASDGARSIVTLEAITGQFYIAVAVARIVATMQAHNANQPNQPTKDTAA